jgi:nicotinate-nucleotide pyrophosphorylase (carboxylating)
VNPIWLEETVRRSLHEDIGYGDLTTEAIVPSSSEARGKIVAKAAGRIAGIEVAMLTFQLLEPNVEMTVDAPDGTDVKPGDTVLHLRGPAASVLMGERVALNFLQRLSGIASATALAVEAVAPYATRIVDTRKTTPGLRALEKYAVRVGGGFNHRLGLDDAVLIKDNHLAVAGGISEAVRRVRERIGHLVKIEVEVETLAQVDEALAARVDTIMLDNMDPETMREAVIRIDRRALVEASGNIRIEHIATVAATGVDIISMGWLTHSAPVLDLSLRLQLTH